MLTCADLHRGDCCNRRLRHPYSWPGVAARPEQTRSFRLSPDRRDLDHAAGAGKKADRPLTRPHYRFDRVPAVSTTLLLLSNLSSLRAGAGQTAAPRRLQNATPRGVSRTSAGLQAADGSPSEIRDRLPMIGSDSSELAHAAFSETLAIAHQQARVGLEADECFARPAVAELTMPMATSGSPRTAVPSCRTSRSGAAAWTASAYARRRSCTPPRERWFRRLWRFGR